MGRYSTGANSVTLTRPKGSAFGTQAAAAGVPMRTLQEWMGHRDIQTTMIYADYSPGAHEADMIARAFRRDAPAPPTPQGGAERSIVMGA